MQLTFKDLKQQKFVISAEPSETVGQVKEKISKEKGWDAPLLKLIYSGKILQDDKTIESYNIEEKGFIVCMVSKPKTQPASSQGPSTPAKAVTSTPAAPPAPAPSTNTSTSAPAAAAPATPSPASSGAAQPAGGSFNDPSALLSGSQSEEVISHMESMGFARSDITRAMRAAFFNPDRAIDYLLNGIPENIQQEQQQRESTTPAAPQAPAAPATGGTPAASGEDEPVNLFEAAAQAGNPEARGGARGAAAGGDAQSNLDFLRNNPHFQQLRQLVQQQPQMLEPILQQVGAGNPQIAQLIGQNEEQFLQLLSEEDDSLPPGTTQIHVTEEERDAIERLCRLGFERDLVIQAYFACDKNEELAANYLFDNSDDADD
ncbi:XPC-binding domain-containing protein [Aspergillus pseudoustus]|uniref:UV excision repair protein RAD23 n=1 Tax=Aspergillus pseudoustus TaxID=1810923 RepID=A0ABR4KKS1_9EURO